MAHEETFGFSEALYRLRQKEVVERRRTGLQLVMDDSVDFEQIIMVGQKYKWRPTQDDILSSDWAPVVVDPRTYPPTPSEVHPS